MLALAESTAYLLWGLCCGVNILLAGLFAGMETGLYVISRVRVELHAEAGLRSAKILRHFLQHTDGLLAMLLIGTNIHQYLAAFAVSAMFVRAGAGDAAEWYTLAVTTPLLFVLKDSLPKNLFQRGADRLVPALAVPLRGFDLLFKVLGLTPFVRAFSAGLLRLMGRRTSPGSLLGHDGLRRVFAEGHAAGMLTGTQRAMADRVMHLGRVRLTDVLQPMDRVVTAPVACCRETFLGIVRDEDYSRLPLLDETGHAAGVVSVHAVLLDEARRPPRELMLPTVALPEQSTVTTGLLALREARRNLAVVVDPRGSPVGIVTIKDLVEEIVGELDAW